MVNPNQNTYEYTNTIVVSVYALKSGTWTKIQDYYVQTDGGSYSTGGNRSFNWSVNDNFQLGNGISAFGLSVSSVNIGSATLNSFSHAKWQATGSSGGTRTATPNGEQSIVTVRPV